MSNTEKLLLVIVAVGMMGYAGAEPVSSAQVAELTRAVENVARAIEQKQCN